MLKGADGSKSRRRMWLMLALGALFAGYISASLSEMFLLVTGAGPTLAHANPNVPAQACQPWQVSASPNPSAEGNYLYGVAAISPSDVWAVGYQTNQGSQQTLTIHWDGTQWNVVPSPNVDTSSNWLYGVAASRPGGDPVAPGASDDVWAVGYSSGAGGIRTLVIHWDGTQWSIIPTPNSGSGANYLTAVTAIASNDIWAVGYQSTSSDGYQTLTLHYDGSQWTVIPSPNLNLRVNVLNGVAAATTNDVWAVGEGALEPNFASNILILHWDGAAWNVAQTPYGGTNSVLHSVAVVSANDVWAVGEALEARALIMHWGGVSWDFAYSPDLSNAALYGVTALSANNVWAVGTYAGRSSSKPTLIEHWNGSGWSIISSPSPSSSSYNSLNAVAAISANDVWAVGTYASSQQTATLVARYTGGTTFTDVRPEDYFYEPVNYLYCHGAVSGYSDNTFRPYNTNTRAQLTKIVVLAEGWALYTPPTPTFRDVPATHAFYQYVETAYNHSIISGYGCGPGCLEFRPDGIITRGQLCKVVVLAQGWALYAPPSPTFRDVPATYALYPHIETAYAHNIISGYSCGARCLEFRPGNSATRGQICKVLYSTLTSP